MVAAPRQLLMACVSLTGKSLVFIVTSWVGRLCRTWTQHELLSLTPVTWSSSLSRSLSSSTYLALSSGSISKGLFVSLSPSLSVSSQVFNSTQHVFSGTTVLWTLISFQCIINKRWSNCLRHPMQCPWWNSWLWCICICDIVKHIFAVQWIKFSRILRVG